MFVINTRILFETNSDYLTEIKDCVDYDNYLSLSLSHRTIHAHLSNDHNRYCDQIIWDVKDGMRIIK